MEQRDEIISRSEQLFMRLGVRSVTMDDVSRELGISKKTLYQHFDNKDSLVEEVINTHIQRKRCVIDQIAATAKDALDEQRLIGAFITAGIEAASPGALYDLQKYYRKSWETLMHSQDDGICSSMRRNLERGIREKLYRNDLDLDIIPKIYAKATYMVVEEVSNTASRFSKRQLIWELHNYHVRAIATPKGLKLWEQYGKEMKFYETSKGFAR